MSNRQSKTGYTYGLRVFALVFVASMLWACANIGMPEGGPFDVTPPRLVSATPQERSTKVQDQRIALHFDEFVKINGQDKIIISPPQRKQPIISARGKSILVKLEDSLRANTTYSIYFGDAIVDNNEDNPLENFSYTFSTGEHIDTMQVGGVVLDAQTLEPVPNLLVGAFYDKSGDSVAMKQAFPFAGKTGKTGKFAIRGLKDSVYRVYALSDNDNDNRFDGLSEGFAFSTEGYKTSKLDSLKTDTIRIDSIVRRDTLHRDSLVTYPHTYYYPDNVVLRYYLPSNRQKGLQRHSRLDSLHFQLEFAEELFAAPTLQSLDKPQVSAQSLFVTSVTGRTATYWLKDKDLISKDSIRFSISYVKTDSLYQEHERTDTLTFYKPKHKSTTAKPAKKGKEESPFRLTFGGASGVLASTPEDSLTLTASLPIESLSPKQIILEERRDSVFKPVEFNLVADSLNALRYHLDFKRLYGASYRAKIDSGQVHSLYGHVADSASITQSVSAENELGHLQIAIEGIEGRTFVQLLNKSDQVLLTAEARVLQDTIQKSDSLTNKRPPVVLFRDLKPDEYYVRLYVDLDGNGVWTTGDYPTREPEPMYYSPSKYPVKKSFTTDEKWNPLATPLDKQKPQDLLKAKPEQVTKREDKNKEYYKRMAAKNRKR